MIDIVYLVFLLIMLHFCWKLSRMHNLERESQKRVGHSWARISRELGASREEIEKCTVSRDQDFRSGVAQWLKENPNG